MSNYTNFTSIGDSSLGLGDDNRAFGDFIGRMRARHELEEMECVLTHNTPLPIESCYSNFKGGVYGDRLCLNFKGELITLSIPDELVEIQDFIEKIKDEIHSKTLLKGGF